MVKWLADTETRKRMGWKQGGSGQLGVARSGRVLPRGRFHPQLRNSPKLPGEYPQMLYPIEATTGRFKMFFFFFFFHFFYEGGNFGKPDFRTKNDWEFKICEYYTYMAQNIVGRCQKYFQYFIAIEMLSQDCRQILENILSQHYSFNFLK